MVRLALYLTAVVCACGLVATLAQDTTSYGSQNVFTSAGTIYNRTGSLQPLHFNLYGIPVPSNYTNPDILLTLNATSGGTGLGLYCNPGYGEFADPNGNYPGPGYAQWYSDLSVSTNQVFISKNDPYYTSPTANASTSPFFICSVINGNSETTDNYTLVADIIPDNRSLAQTEQNALASIYNSCCQANGACNAWKTQNSGYVSANGGVIDTDFCGFPNQICSPTGNLFRLNLDNFNLSCAWPGAEFSQFTQLATLDLSDNVNLTGNTTVVMETVANLTSLQFVDLTGNTGITGTIDSGAANTNLCKAAQTSLISLSLDSVGLKGSIPSCLISSGSKMIYLDLASNNFTGSIPNVFPSNSSIELFHVDYNQLTGPLPSSLANAANLVDIDTTQNSLTGTIPSAIGSITSLQNFVVKMNNLSGAIPDTFGTAPNLGVFDAKQNRLTSLPAAWTNASYDATNSSFVNIRFSLNEITGPFPTGLINAQQLTYLVINQNNMTGPLPTNSSMFPALRALNVSFNQFTGSIPSQLGQSGIFQSTPLYLSTGQALQQVFDLSHNNFNGSLPSFLAEQAVPAWTQQGIFLQGNHLNVSCAGTEFSYITSICPNGNLSNGAASQSPATSPPAASAASAAGTLTPSSAATSPPAQNATSSGAGIVEVPTASQTTAPAPPTTVQAQTSDNQAPSASKSAGTGLSGGAIAGIVIGVLAAIALAVFIAFFAFRRRREPMMPQMNGGTFGMPHFSDGEFGRKSSLKKGLNSLSGNASGFERFNDEQHDVELSPSPSKT